MRPTILLLLGLAACSGGDTDVPDGVDPTGDTDTDTDPLPAPVIDAIDPDAGEVGTLVTVSGTDLGATADDVEVLFGDLAVDVIDHAPTAVTFEVPEGADDAVITVRTDGGEAVSDAPFDVLFPPRIDSMTPTYGVVGTEVVLAGAHLAGAESLVVTFAGEDGPIEASVISGSEASVTVTVPDGAVTGPITVVADGLEGVSEGDFSVLDRLLEVTGCDTAVHATDGQLRCWGLGFDPEEEIRVHFVPTLEGVEETTTATEATTSTATAPPPSTIGTYEVVVTQGPQEVVAPQPVIVFDWVRMTLLRGRLADGSYPDQPIVGQELAFYYSPGTNTSRWAPTRVELLDEDLEVAWSSAPNGAYGGGSGFFAARVRPYEGPTGTFHGRVVWEDPNSDATLASPISDFTVTIVAAED